MDRWHCHCTAGSSTSLMEIRTYDPRSMEPLLYNLSYPVMFTNVDITNQYLVEWTCSRNVFLDNLTQAELSIKVL